MAMATDPIVTFDAEVSSVFEVYLDVTLSSSQSTRVSSALASSLFPIRVEYKWPITMDITREFNIGDRTTLDAYLDEDGQYVPVQAQSCDRCPFMEMKFHCFDALVYPQTVVHSGFPFHRHAIGKLIKDTPPGNSLRVQFRILPQYVTVEDNTLPIYEKCCLVDGAPLSLLLNQYVSCLICPKRPYLDSGNNSFEVTSMELVTDEHRVSTFDHKPSWMQEGVTLLGRSPAKGMSYCYLQCSENYNIEMAGCIRDAFAFVIEHTSPIKFLQLLKKYPEFMRIVVSMLVDSDLAPGKPE